MDLTSELKGENIKTKSGTKANNKGFNQAKQYNSLEIENIDSI